jgi:hypothetical protein
MKKVQFRLAECNAILGKDSGEKRKYGSIFNKDPESQFERRNNSTALSTWQKKDFYFFDRFLVFGELKNTLRIS